MTDEIKANPIDKVTVKPTCDMFTNLQSDPISDLYKALATAQGQIENAGKDTDNTFFKSKYATLASVRMACRDALSKNGLAVIQQPTVFDGKLYLLTTLSHNSGQWMRSFLPIRPVKDDPQGLGSAITYMRRYALAAITGVAPDDDDDGNAASGKKESVVAEGNKRTHNPAIDKWVSVAIGDINACETLDDLAKAYRLAIKHAQASGCTDDQIDMMAMQKDNRKAFLSDPEKQVKK